MARYIRLMQDCLGLNNAVSPTKGKFDANTGAGELSVAVNVVILDDGAIERRPGITATAVTGIVQSIWTGNNGTFFVQNGMIRKLASDFTSTGIVAVSNSDVSYCDVQDKVYYINGYQRGIIQGIYNYPWTFSMDDDYAGPNTFKLFQSPPTGTKIDLYNGRMYVAFGNTLFFSEPFGYSMYDYARSFIWFEHPIIDFKAVSDGLFVSTEKGVYSLLGKTPDEFVITKVSNSPAFAGTIVSVFGDELLITTSQFTSVNDKSLLWTSQEGIYLGTSNGLAKNITLGRLKLPTVTGGRAAYHKGKYVVFLYI